MSMYDVARGELLIDFTTQSTDPDGYEAAMTQTAETLQRQ